MKKSTSGFTIVELLIVIVVIAILAAIAIVAYRGIQGKAHDVAVQSDLRQIYTQLEMFQLQHGYYPTPENTDMAALGLSVSAGSYWQPSDDGSNLGYCHNNNGRDNAIALIAGSANGNLWYHNGSSIRQLPPGGTLIVDDCAAIGAPITADLTIHRTYFYDSNVGGWVSWLNL